MILNLTCAIIDTNIMTTRRDVLDILGILTQSDLWLDEVMEVTAASLSVNTVHEPKLSQGSVWTKQPTSVVKWWPDAVAVYPLWRIVLLTEPMALPVVHQMWSPASTSESKGTALFTSEYGTFCVWWKKSFEPARSVRDPKKVWGGSSLHPVRSLLNK